jgi:hypothetical protein
MTRAVGIALAVLGAFIGASPFLHWYRIDVSGRDLPVSGIDAAGELWSLVPLAAVIVAAGLAIVLLGPDPSGRQARWLAGIAAVAAAFATVWALKGAVDIPAVGVPVGVEDGPGAPLAVQPLAFAAAAAAACVASVSLAWLRSGSD